MLQRPLIAPTANPLLDKALADKLGRRRESGGSLGGLEPLAVRLGLLQNSLRPRFREPQLVMFAADHGLAVEGLSIAQARSSAELVRLLLMRRLPVAAFARSQHVELHVVDCGLADNLPAHERLWVRKIAHGTRNPRVAQAMTLEQAHAGVRIGTEIGEQLRGDALMCAAVGVGAQETAALLLARLGRLSLRSLVSAPADAAEDHAPPQVVLLERVLARHRDAREPMQALAAFGGFDTAVMAGAMLAAASRRHLIIVDGLPACAALLLASRLAPAVTDYCVFCRSHTQRGLTQALGLFGAGALLEMGLQATDGTGAVLAWPMVASAASLLSEVPEGEEAGETQPGALGAVETKPGGPHPVETQPGALRPLEAQAATSA